MNKLTPFFREVIELRWSDFVQMETDETYTSAQAVVLAIVRACYRGRLPAIKESLARIDGKVHEEIEVEYPKFYILFPYAKSVEGGDPSEEVVEGELMMPEAEAAAPPLITGSLRSTLERLSDAPRFTVKKILDAADKVDAAATYAGTPPADDPLVKSVICAGLMKMAHNGNLGAIFEVFDQIDGKLAEKIKLIGDDVYITRYDEIAPKGARKDEDGVYRLEADNTTSSWAVSLKNLNKAKNDRRF